MKQVYEATGKTVDEAIDLACAQAGVGLDGAEIEVLEFGSKGFFGIGGKNAKVRFTVYGQDEQDKKDKKHVNPQSINKKEQKAPVERRAGYEKITTRVEAFGSNIKRERETTPARRNENSGATVVSKPPATAISYDKETVEKIKAQVLAFLEPVFESLQVAPESISSFKDGVLMVSFSGQSLGSLIGRRGETLNAIQYLTNLVVNRHAADHVRIVLDVEGYRHGREETLIHLAHKMAEKAIRTGRRVELEPMNPNERRVVHLALQEDNRVETLSKGEEPYRRVIISCKRGSRNR